MHVILLMLIAATGLFASDCPCSGYTRCEVTVNVADWFGLGPAKGHAKLNVEVDDRNAFELGWHSGDGSVAALRWLDVPPATHPRITRYFVDAYSIFTERGEFSGSPKAVALHALHSLNDYDFSGFAISHCKDCMLWIQTPVGQYRQVERYIGHLRTGLLTRDVAHIKLSVFANVHGDEVLSEITTSFEYCFEPTR